MSEKAHSAFNKSLDYFEVQLGKFGSDNWTDNLCKLTLALNSEINPVTKLCPIEVYRNRSLKAVGPSEFYKTSGEQKSSFLRFSNKVKNTIDSNLKFRGEQFTKGQKIKVKFKNSEPRFATVMSENDKSELQSVLVKLDGFGRPVSVSKNDICK